MDSISASRYPRGRAKVFTEWTVLPHRPIEKAADNLWRVSGKLGQVQRQMVLARMRDGRIVVDNALALDAAEMAEVEAWGESAVLIVPLRLPPPGRRDLEAALPEVDRRRAASRAAADRQGRAHRRHRGRRAAR